MIKVLDMCCDFMFPLLKSLLSTCVTLCWYDYAMNTHSKPMCKRPGGGGGGGRAHITIARHYQTSSNLVCTQPLKIIRWLIGDEAWEGFKPIVCDLNNNNNNNWIEFIEKANQATGAVCLFANQLPILSISESLWF